MAQHRLGIIMHGITGRMGYNQHLVRSVCAMRDQGGVTLPNGDKVVPDPIIVGRNAEKLAEIGKKHGIARQTTDLDAALANKDDTLFFDAGSTQMRAGLITRAIEAGKDIYCEKPISDDFESALKLVKFAKWRETRSGVVQDKLSLPGLRKIKMLRDSGFFGRMLSVRGEFGYWVFEGDWQAAQRPSWNYRKQDGGGIILDMLCHWRYVLDNLFGGHPRDDRGRRLPWIAGGRELLVAGLVDAPRRRGAGHMHRAPRHPVPHGPGSACRIGNLGLFSILLDAKIRAPTSPCR